jgi:hypothetical protein
MATDAGSTRRIVVLRTDRRDHEQAALVLDDRADVQLGAPLPGTPHTRVGLLPGIQEQLGEVATSRLDLVLLVTRCFKEALRGGIRHEDLSGLP